MSRKHHQILEAIAFLLETTPSALARELVESFASEEDRRNPRVAEVLRLRAEERAAAKGELTPIKRTRKARG